MKAHWIFFDVPYAEDAGRMRGILGYQNGEQVSCIFADECKDVPEAIQKLEKAAEEKKIALEKDLVLVYPLDLRHGLAWAVKDIADKRGWEFERHIPSGKYPKADELVLFSHYDNGSAEMKLDKPSASARVAELHQEALDEFPEGDMLPVMGYLRHALSLSITHTGWISADTLLSLHLLLRAYIFTGNPDNIEEGKFLVKQALVATTNKMPAMGAPGNKKLAELFSKIGDQVDYMGGEPVLGIAVRGIAIVL